MMTYTSDTQEDEEEVRDVQYGRRKGQKVKKMKPDRDPVRWGTQETIWKIPSSVLNYTPSERTEELAQPRKVLEKKYEPEYQVGSEKKSGSVSQSFIDRMSQPKRLAATQQTRVTKDTEASSTKQEPDLERCAKMAVPKTFHKDFEFNRYQQPRVETGALRYRASERIKELAVPHQKYLESSKSSEVAPQQIQKTISKRTDDLSKSRPLHPNFRMPRTDIEDISPSAKFGKATERIVFLAQPRNLSTQRDTLFRQDAFSVKKTALKGIVPQRIEQLCVPVKH